jgi:Tol biopolymer transport system component
MREVKRSWLKAVAAVLMSLAVAVCGLAGTATAGGPAKAGSTFITSYLNLPARAIPGGGSGSSGDGFDRSSVSANGRFVAFVSAANTLSKAAHPDAINVFRKDQTTGAVELVSRASGANGKAPAKSSISPRISGDGSLVAFVTIAGLSPTDVDGAEDVYVRNMTTKQTRLATPDTASGIFRYSLSADGNFIAFDSGEVLAGVDANGKLDVFRRNLGTGAVDLVSRIPASETAANNSSTSPSISGDGRWVAFRSDATNIATGFVETNGPNEADVFVRDMSGAVTKLVSSRFGNVNESSNGDSGEPVIAGTPADSTQVKVAFSSYATNLAAGVDPSTNSSVYLKTSLAAAASGLISVSTGGQNADSRAHTPSISDDGNLVFFSSDASNLGAGDNYYGAYLRNVSAGTTELGSARNDYALASDVSANGNMIVWGESGATTDSDPDAPGVFARRIPDGPARFVSRPKGNRPFLVPAAYAGHSSDGRSISSNGRFVALMLSSSRLNGPGVQNQIFRRDLLTGRLELASRKNGSNGAASDYSGAASISNDGRRVAFISYSKLVAADTDTTSDAYVRDFATRKTILVSRATGANGADADSGIESAAISGDGSRVVFDTDSTNLGSPGGQWQVYVRDLAAFKTIPVSRSTGFGGVIGDGDSHDPELSDNGRIVAFSSRATNLDPDDASPQSDVYVRNLSSGTTLLASRLPGLGGAKSVESHFYPAISGNGKVIAFRSGDPAMVPGSGPWAHDQVISRVLATGVNRLVSRSRKGTIANDSADEPSLNRDGSVIAFQSYATNLIARRGGADRQAIFIKNMKSARVSGPPAFGITEIEPPTGARSPSISANGRCVSFIATGYNAASGNASDLPSAYVYAAGPGCSNPRGTPVPKLSGVSLKPAKLVLRDRRSGATLRFRLNTKSTVTITLSRLGRGQRLTARLVKKNQRPGRRAVRLGGKVGAKKLRPGRYRVTVSARNGAGKSTTVRKILKVVRR